MPSLFLFFLNETLKPRWVQSDAAVQRGVAEANVFSLASHMYWGTWALMQARWSSIDFDYMGYAALRWGEYRRRRDEFLSQAASVFASSA